MRQNWAIFSIVRLLLDLKKKTQQLSRLVKIEVYFNGLHLTNCSLNIQTSIGDTVESPKYDDFCKQEAWAKWPLLQPLPTWPGR